MGVHGEEGVSSKEWAIVYKLLCQVHFIAQEMGQEAYTKLSAVFAARPHHNCP